MAAWFMAMLMAGAAEAPDLAWLEGEWCTEAANGRQTCELWGPARGGAMLGTSQTVQDGRTRDFEYMRIMFSNGVAVLHASPGGAASVPFAERGREASGITFGNSGHDYPQRIRYWRRGGELVAEISLSDGSKSRRWVYRRVR